MIANLCSLLPSPDIVPYALMGGLVGLFASFILSSAILFGEAMFGWTTPDRPRTGGYEYVDRLMQNKFEVGCFMFGGIFVGAAVGYLLSFVCG
jgi:hypothetical protein